MALYNKLEVLLFSTGFRRSERAQHPIINIHLSFTTAMCRVPSKYGFKVVNTIYNIRDLAIKPALLIDSITFRLSWTRL